MADTSWTWNRAHIVQRVPEDRPYPITPKDHGVDFLMDHRHLWLRSRRQHAALLVRHEVIKGIRDYFDSHGFILVDTPIFTPAACEGTTTLFEVDYFDEEKLYLAQSGQLYNEATAMAFGKTYCFGPTFRAEKSKTRRHLTEFWMVEPEMAYADLEDVKRVGEELVVSVVGAGAGESAGGAEVLERDVSKLEAIQAPFHRMSYDDAVLKLQSKGSEIQWGTRFREHGRDAADRRSRPAASLSIAFRRRSRRFISNRRRSGLKSRWGRTSSRPKAMARSSAAGSAFTIWICCCSVSRNTTCRAEAFDWYLDLRELRVGSARRVWDGRRALCGVDVRAGAYSRDHRVPAHAVPHAAVTPQNLKQSHIAIIGAPMDLGAGRSGVDMGPSALRLAGLNEKLASLGTRLRTLGNVLVDQPESLPVGKAEARYLAADRAHVRAAGGDGGKGRRQWPRAGGAGRRSFDRGRHGGGDVAAFSQGGVEAGLDLD